MSYHSDMIKEISKQPNKLDLILEMSEISLKTEISFINGDIDILAKGICWYTGTNKLAVIEVKSNFGLIPHYKKYQLPKYIQQYPEAKQFVCYGKNKSLNFEDFTFLEN